MKRNTNQPLFYTVVAMGLSVIIGLSAYMSAEAATTRYDFLVRGTVVSVNYANKVMNVSATIASDRAKEDLLGKVIPYSVGKSSFFKWTLGEKKGTTFAKGVVQGDEVVIRGSAKSDGSYVAQWVVTNDTAFTIIGKVQQHNKDAMKIRVVVSSSTYKESALKNKELVVLYNTGTKLYGGNGKAILADQIPEAQQYIKFTGRINNGNFIASKVWDNTPR